MTSHSILRYFFISYKRDLTLGFRFSDLTNVAHVQRGKSKHFESWQNPNYTLLVSYCCARFSLAPLGLGNSCSDTRIYSMNRCLLSSYVYCRNCSVLPIVLHKRNMVSWTLVDCIA